MPLPKARVRQLPGRTGRFMTQHPAGADLEFGQGAYQVLIACMLGPHGGVDEHAPPDSVQPARAQGGANHLRGDAMRQ